MLDDVTSTINGILFMSNIFILYSIIHTVSEISLKKIIIYKKIIKRSYENASSRVTSRSEIFFSFFFFFFNIRSHKNNKKKVLDCFRTVIEE